MNFTVVQWLIQFFFSFIKILFSINIFHRKKPLHAKFIQTFSSSQQPHVSLKKKGQRTFLRLKQHTTVFFIENSRCATNLRARYARPILSNQSSPFCWVKKKNKKFIFFAKLPLPLVFQSASSSIKLANCAASLQNFCYWKFSPGRFVHTERFVFEMRPVAACLHNVAELVKINFKPRGVLRGCRTVD